VSTAPNLIIETFTTDQEWHAIRRSGIGGSDTAAVLGLSKWRTPLQVYYEKIGEADPIVETEPMRWGKVLEPVLIQEYANKTGRVVNKPSGVIRLADHPHFIANLDGFTEDGRVLEIKTARSADNWGDEGTDEVPTDYFLQVQHYMAVTGMQVTDIAVLIGGSDFRIYEVEADPELHQMMLKQGAEFWKRVQEATPPDPINKADIIQFTKVINKSKTATEEIIKTVADLKTVKASLKLLENEEEELKSTIQAFMAGCDTLVDLEEKVIATWKSAKAAELFDKDRFEKDQADLYKKYAKTGKPSRRFNLK
jgi:putative phage-type endonuclease